MRKLITTLLPLAILVSASLTWAATGGPDDFGYTWNDAAPFAWIDASTGTQVEIEDDGLSGPFPIGFTFEYYGVNYTSFYISGNGRITFVDQPETFNIPCIPSNPPYLGYIALYWDDLDPAAGGAIYYKVMGSAPNRILVVEYDEVLHWGSETDTLSAEVILSEQTADIFFQYLNPSTELGSNATVGTMSPDGSTGLSVVCNQGILAPNTNIRLHHPPYLQTLVTDDAAAAPSGSTATYEIDIRNVTGTEATVLITFSDNSWDAAADPAYFTVPIGETQTVEVAVTVPGNAFLWSSDMVKVTASWVESPDVQSSIDLTTIAGADWNVIANALPEPMQDAAVVTDEDYIYVFSNYLAPGIEGSFARFDLDGNSESLTEADPGINVTDGAYLWGNLVFPGGINETGEISDHLSVYDISDAEWVNDFTLPQPIAFAAVVVLAEKLYLIGGFDGEEAVNDVWRFDPGSATWRRMASMHFPRLRPAAGVIDGLIMVAGGSDLTFLDSVEIYDPETDTWTEMNPLPEPMYGMADVTCDNQLFLIGGQQDEHARNSVYAYQQDIDTWIPISHLQTGRFSVEADLLNGRIVTAGGMKELFVPINDAETLNLDCSQEIVIDDRDFGTEEPDDDTTDDDTAEDDDTDDDTPSPHGGDDDDDDDCGCGC